MLTISSVFLVIQVYFLRAARFTTGYARLVGQESAPSKCVLMSTSRTVRSDMRGWIVTDKSDRWSVELDVRDLGEGASGYYFSLLVNYSGYAGSTGHCSVGSDFCSPA